MRTFIGTKIVAAEPMTRLAYNLLRKWELPADENGADEGYLVCYQDGGKPNVEGFPGYVSWSPKEQFDNAYREIGAMTFGLAIEALKKGRKVTRAGWNGKGMFLFLVSGGTFHEVEYRPHINMRAVDGQIIPWTANQSDVLAEDWMMVE